jgi:hypothetical protein
METVTINGFEPWNEVKFDSCGEYDAIEIGALEGDTTKILAQNFRRVFVIDPWDGRQQGAPHRYDMWKANTANLKNVFHVKAGSETPDARSFLKSVDAWNLGFVYVDGLHTAEAVVNAVHLVMPYTNNQTRIMVDDIEWPPVRVGCNEAFFQLAPKIILEKIILSKAHDRVKWVYKVNTNAA